MNSSKEITIYDIADKLSISSTTVSRALRDHHTISLKTRQKVKDTAKELGYRQNKFASSLREKKTNTIGVILHELNSYFTSSVLTGIEKITSKAGYDLLIANSFESYEREISNAENLFQKRVDGLIASMTFGTKNLDHYKKFEKRNIPIIFVDRVDENSNFTKVIIDNYKGGLQSTQHLIDQGCKRIVHLTAALQRNVYHDRYMGYKDALKANKIPYRDEYVIVADDLSERSAIETAHKILKMKPMPDGLFACNDFSAAVCMHTLKEHGVKVPENIAIVGFNDDVIGKLVDPQLTTTSYPGITIGEIAAGSIIGHLKNVSDIKNTNRIFVRSELIIRKSSLRKSK